jgi:cation-transporting ATPase E
MPGLSSAEAAARFAAGQYNRPPEPGTKSVRAIVLDNLFSVFNYIIGGIVVFLLAFYLGSGDGRLLWDCVGVFAVAFCNTVIAVVQEVRAKLAMDKVNLLIVREATALRDGAEVSIPHGRIVLGDAIVVKRGDQAVVDGKVLESHRLEMDESLLTGESEPVEKREGDAILSGSFCLSGKGCYEVERLSDGSYASEITRQAQRLKSRVSPLQKQLNRIVEALFGVGVGLAALAVGLGLVRHQLDLELVRKVATIMNGLVPQGLVLTASMIFALGIYRISKVGAVVQSFNAIESFAGVRAICMDKTGTLTQNRMSVRKVTPLAPGVAVEALEGLLGSYARLSSEKNATIRALEAFPGDERAARVDEFPFSSRRKMSVLTVARDGGETTYALGALDLLLEKCEGSGAPAAEGLEVYRNLLFGEVIDGERIDPRADSLGSFRLRPLCIVSLGDRVRPDAREVIGELAGQGIALKILSGDAATSILATCRDIGWSVRDSEVVSGAELDALEGERFEAAVEKSVVFARLRPEQKVRIVQALRARKIHTAMIGDGVNDVPAIKQADVGIAMEEGAAITREVADIILRENRFTLLPAVLKEGRKIIGAVETVAKLFLTKNCMVIYVTLASLLLLWGFPLTPRRLGLFNLFAIGAPAMPIAFGNASRERPKRVAREIVTFAATSALVIVGIGQAAFAAAQRSLIGPPDVLKMAMLATMTMTALANYLVIVWRQGRRGAHLLWAALLAAAFALAITKPGASGLPLFFDRFYEIRTLDWAAWRIVLAASACGGLVLAGAQKLRAALVERG